MRRLVITQNVTLDGAVEMLDDWFDAQGQGDQADLTEEMQRQDAEADGFLCGRRTFLDLRGYWRDLDDDSTGVSAYLHGVSKYVVSSTLGDPEWDRTTVLRGDPVAEVAALKQTEGREIVLTGSIRLAHALIVAGLVDEYRQFVYPVVQGRGRRLFPDGYVVPRMETVGSRSFRGGITLLKHRPA
ncbi:dihydrofolate reductase family protein [uncultured Nocardioides sp.]|uniref:dihydrofolate reductase family protein n=1 Tax=uncultured Nocardioides sp. TaxID=198441 RepID=UPI0026226CFA|nr:dihydrofolate reductase family protein [uncultured Nocardioides sp.]